MRTDLFDLSAELVERLGQGERPAGQTCDELWLIATDSTFCLFSFLVISSNKPFLFLAFIFCCALLRGGLEVEVLNFKPQSWTMQVQVIIFVLIVFQ